MAERVPAQDIFHPATMSQRDAVRYVRRIVRRALRSRGTDTAIERRIRAELQRQIQGLDLQNSRDGLEATITQISRQICNALFRTDTVEGADADQTVCFPAKDGRAPHDGAP